MIRHLTGTILGLVVAAGALLLGPAAGTAQAGNRYPPMYNASSAKVTLVAYFSAGGGSSTGSAAGITWKQANGREGKTYVLTPASDSRSCTVTLLGGGYGQVDVTCDYTNDDGTHASVTVTICWLQRAVDTITVNASP